jgi:myo-inositol-1(or 4)-monophosphatase
MKKMNKMMNDRFDLGLALVRQGGALALDYFNNRSALSVKHKGLQDVVSEADLNTEILIRDAIAKAFPADAFLGEETGRTDFADGQGVWVVDPIDGTQPFVSGLSSWCVSIAFVQHGKAQFGMVYAPVRDELFAGGIGRPATLNGNPIQGHPGLSIRDGLTGTGYSPKSGIDRFLPSFERFLRAGGMFYRDGSGALMLCYVAAGRLLAFFEPVIMAWDCMGAIAVLDAAGLKTSDFMANDGLAKGNMIIAANKSVYAEISGLVDYGEREPV